MTDLVDLDVVDDVEELTADNTIGRAVLAHGEEHEGDVLVDLRRLRRMLLAFEDAHESRFAWLSTRESPEGMPSITLQNEDPATDLIVLCGRTPTRSYPPTEDEEVVRS